MRPSASAPISPRVSGVSGQWRVTKSELSSSSPRGTPPLRPVCSRRTPKPSSRRATALPIRPIPTIPTVVSCRSRPSMKSGPQVVHSPRRTSASPSVSPRAMPSMSATARSAVLSVSTSGVCPTGIPRAVAASRSTLSTPTA